MKGLLTWGAAGLIAVASIGAAEAEPSRGLPRGEERPAVIEVLYDSPFGEVQFTRIGASEHSGFLRNAQGHLVGFQSVRGPLFCEQWLTSDKSSPLPADCEFLFYDDLEGRTLAVRSSEMTETSIFQATKGKMRSLGRVLGAGGGGDVAL